MANLKFSSDLIDDALFRAGEPTDGTSDFQNQALVNLNRAYRTIWTGGGEFLPEGAEDWLWLLKEPAGLLLLVSPITAGTVLVTNGSASITFSSAPAVSVAGWHFQVTGSGDIFVVSAHTGGAAGATLDQVYTGATNAAATYTLGKLDYTLAADVLKLIAPLRCHASKRGEVGMVDIHDITRDLALNSLTAGIPTRFCMLTDSKVRFNRPGQTAVQTRVEYDYLRVPADLTDSTSEEPLVPLQYRQVLSDITLVYLLLDKSDDRAATVGLQAKAGLSAMARENKAIMSRRKIAQEAQARIETAARALAAVDKGANG